MEKEQLVSLITAVQQGQADAATDLYNAFHQDLYYYIQKTVNDATLAEDLLQDAFIEIFQTIDKLNEPAAFITWSRQIAYHKSTAYFRKRKEILADEDEDGYSIFDTVEEDRTEFIPDEALDKEDLKQTIHEMIAQLPQEQRSALLLRYFDELSVKDIAEIQGVSEGTVKSRLNYGRKAIQKSVEEYEKKNDVKLHCAGIIPLLLWLFREYAVANGISLTANTASASYTVSSAASTVAAEGAKAVGKFAIKKVIAGIVAAAVVTSGVVTTAKILDNSDKKSSKPAENWLSSILGQQEETTAPTKDWLSSILDKQDAPAMDMPIELYGYGSTSSFQPRYDLRIEEMDDSHIRGHVTTSIGYSITLDTDITGEGTVSGNTVCYIFTFEDPLVNESKMSLEYNKETKEFTIVDYIIQRYPLKPLSEEPSALIAENASWQGSGTSVYAFGLNDTRLFTLDISVLRENEIAGTFTIHFGDQLEYTSAFTGIGYAADGVCCYQILFESPRSETFFGVTSTDTTICLTYNKQAETFSTWAFGPYTFTIGKINSEN